jgi:hypothetical protein
MSFNNLSIVIPAMIRAANRRAGGPLNWPDMDIPEDATTMPASMFPPADVVGQLCRLAGNISTTDDNTYPAGAIFECVGADPSGRLTIYGYGLRLVQVPPHALEVILR